ncbi:hypothetical protein KIN20_031069 [Parelaphostrongylus tenuis]|uniref:Uncharacterized protein n=1 Tax=Parelaphostrongylus tenuis TaxID=148309 RepID=A0AAD5R4N1_PARTN|nr:hypothetical protein KIN20_031069 [Parelaphostrongylus tenuis]
MDEVVVNGNHDHGCRRKMQLHCKKRFTALYRKLAAMENFHKWTQDGTHGGQPSPQAAVG